MGILSRPGNILLIIIGVTTIVLVCSSFDSVKSQEVKARRRRQDKDAGKNPEASDDGASKKSSSTPKESNASEDPNNPEGIDPFPLSVEWAIFVKRMDEISEVVKKELEKMTSLISEKNPDFAANKTKFLGEVLIGFAQNFKPLTEIFVPLQEQLDLNKAYTIFNPAVDLKTLDKCNALAKSNPTKDIDKARLKWIEVNAMAATVHHIFNRLTPEFEQYGLAEISEVLEIQYPSWTAIASQNETGNTYQDMVASEMVDYIHKEMDSLGDANHLIRVLERLLNKKLGLKGWDPSKTNINKYCYGNNIFGLIHEKFDVVIDAAQYLVMSDMKYSIVQILKHVYHAYQVEATGGEKFDFQKEFEEIVKNMTTRIDKKIKFSKLAEPHPDVVIVPGPTVFRCDPLPKGCDDAGPKVTAPNCPPGVYMQQKIAYANGKALTTPQDVSEHFKLDDGTVISCLALEEVAFSSNGSVLHCKIVNKECIDGNGTKLSEPHTVEIIPVLVDKDLVPYHRDNLIETFPEKPQWGKYDCSKDPDHPQSPPAGPLPSGTPPVSGGPGETPETPPGKGEPGEPAGPLLPPADWNCTLGPNDKGMGYIDCRPPGINNDNTAEFTLAFPGYLESELVLNPEGKCIGTCREYNRPTSTCTNKTTHCDLYRKSHCLDKDVDCMKQSQCPNKAKRCIRTSRVVEFCPAAPGTGRVYDWYTIDGKPHQAASLHDNATSMEPIDITKCSGGKVMKAGERWEMEDGVILVTPEYCELCLCVCSDPILPEGHHNFDIASLTTETANGFVVAALRFEKKENTLFLNIQQGKVSPDGKIDPSTLAWLEYSAHTPSLVPLGAAGFDKINVDIIEPGKITDVLTGIQWKVENHALVLEAGFSSYDGKALSGPPEFRGAKFPPPKEKRERQDLGEPITPLKQNGPSQPYPISDNSKYIEFDASSLVKDGGQAVIPFFDLQPMKSPDEHFRPLKNVGILYKSKAGSGGFITTSAKF